MPTSSTPTRWRDAPPRRRRTRGRARQRQVPALARRRERAGARPGGVVSRRHDGRRRAGAPGVLLFGGGVLGEAGEVRATALALRLADDSPTPPRLGAAATSGASPPLLGHAGSCSAASASRPQAAGARRRPRRSVAARSRVVRATSTAPTAAAAATPLARKGTPLSRWAPPLRALWRRRPRRRRGEGAAEARDARAAARGLPRQRAAGRTLSGGSGGAAPSA